MKSLLCIDIGTSSIKGGVINESGTLEQWNRVSLYAPSGEDFNHWDPLHWVDAIVELIAGLGGPVNVSGVAVSGNGPTVVPVFENGTPSYEALLWLDKRNIKIDDQPSFFLPKVKWFSVNQPRLYERTNLFFSCPEYICYLLTGEAVTITPSGEFSSYIWDSSGIEAYGLDKEKFPPFVPVRHRIGTVQKKAEEKF
jgi:xylulokinase